MLHYELRRLYWSEIECNIIECVVEQLNNIISISFHRANSDNVTAT